MKHYTEVLTKEEIADLNAYYASTGFPARELLDRIWREYEATDGIEHPYSDRNAYFRASSDAFLILSTAYDTFGKDEPVSKIIRKYLDEVSPEKCPKEGGFYGHKYCVTGGTKVVAELYIPDDAKRVNPYFSDKCRCDKAVVKNVYHLEGFEKFKAVPYSGVARSAYETICNRPYVEPVVYYTGATVTPKNGFDSNRFNECAPGIHFFVGTVESMLAEVNGLKGQLNLSC